MPVPKRKKSKAKRKTRRAQNSRPPRTGRSLCPKCGEPKQPHRVCNHCGTYRGLDVLRLEA